MRKNKQAEVARISSSISFRLSKEILKKSKFFKKKDNKAKEITKPKNKQLYTEALASKVDNILKLKEDFSNLLAKKIENIYNLINSSRKIKFRINMTMKDFSKKQIIILMSNNNKSKPIITSSLYITNLNRTLKNIKSNVIADFV